MKKQVYLLVLAIVVTAIGIMAFRQIPYRPHNYEPIMMSRADLEGSFDILPAREIVQPGKIWVYNNYILLIEQYKGIHIIDNTNPNSPQRIRFINILGCTELAVREGIIYANNAVDLIGVKAEPSSSTFYLTSRNRNVMPMISSPEHWNDWYYENRLPNDMIIVRWEPLNP